MDVTREVERLPTMKVSAVAAAKPASWLIDELWMSSACGIIGGQPKCCKSWLGLDMAVSVASGTPCLGRFAVAERGPALVFLAEDSIDNVRDRVRAIAKGRGLALADLDVTLITSPVLRLDSVLDQERLKQTVDEIRPRLLLLDPLVRLHRLDENNAREISGLLGYLRELQRLFGTAVVLAHHASKRSSTRPGQGLRGSSDLHAFGDSNVYLSRHGDEIELAVEHRAAAAIAPLRLRLVATDDEIIHLRTSTEAPSSSTDDLQGRILGYLSQQAGAAVPRTELRKILRVNNQRLGQALADLLATASIVQTPAGFAANLRA
jgi:hypothetical protein